MALRMIGPLDLAWGQSLPPLRHDVVINEIHYTPDIKTEAVEFIELVNAGTSAVDLSDWSLLDAVSFAFPAGMTLAPGGFVVVAEDPTALQTKFAVKALGPWTGTLSNEGETILLCDTARRVVDRVDYKQGFPWPTVGDPPGYSIELIHPALDNDLGGNWRASVSGGGAQGSTPRSIFPWTQVWRYNQAGTELGMAWRGTNFNDSAWASGAGLLYVEDAAGVTPKGTALTIGRLTYYFRTWFTFSGDPSRTALQFTTMVDDGALFYLNGQEFYRLGVAEGAVGYTTLASRTVGDAASEGPFTVAMINLVKGENVLAVEVHQVSAGSSDIVFGMTLATMDSVGNMTGRGPTPGRSNSVLTANAPPAIRQVEHNPVQPGSTQPVTITARITDPNGVAGVTLSYQGVNPGSYFSKDDRTYAEPKNWISVGMQDDGKAGDALAGDGLYTVQIPATVQAHRRLVRYRITATDGLGTLITVPYADDPQPNFAYFVYDGIPAWRGAIKPGDAGPMGQVMEYGTDVMRSLPAYHLIAREADVIKCQYNSGYENTLFKGTLVCEGVVYDPVEYKIRGEWSTYECGKNKWRFFFTRGHDLQARDNTGQPYGTGRKGMDLSACAVPWVPVNRGMAGVDEALAMALYNLAGVPSSKTHFLQFRVIDNAVEASPTSQYEGDLWGLYLAIERLDGRFLDEHDLPDGNLYKMEGQGDRKNQGPTQPADGSDLTVFRNGYNQTNTVAWWKANLNLQGYYSFVAVNRAVNNMDLREGYNVYYYHDPQTNLWTVVPWDLDMLYLPVTHWSGVLNIQNCLNHPEFRIGYQNRGREIQDLLLSTDKVGQLVDELAAFVNPQDQALTMVDVDQAMWDYHPRTASDHRGMFYKNPYTHNDFNGQSITRTLVSADHEGLMQWIKDFILPPLGGGSTYTGQGAPYYNGADFLDQEVTDGAIPNMPTVTYIGPAGYPTDNLRFRTSSFSSRLYGFKAMQWRIAEVTDVSAPALDPAAPKRYEIEAAWTSAEITPFRSDMEIPAGVAEAGLAYRVRCRMEDTTGRWSHWSEPVQFIAGIALMNKPRLTLQITEIMYHPPVSPSEEGWDLDEFEFIELMNVGSMPIDLSDLQLKGGVEFAFAGSHVTQLAPGAYVLVVENRMAFECRYGTALTPWIAGEYDGKLADGGERIIVKDLQTGILTDFEYQDTWYALTDGQGRSLVSVGLNPVDPGQPGQKASWRTSYRWGGSPGMADNP